MIPYFKSKITEVLPKAGITATTAGSALSYLYDISKQHVTPEMLEEAKRSGCMLLPAPSLLSIALIVSEIALSAGILYYRLYHK
jgi:hypothetical protein